MRVEGLEPPRLAALEPKSSASTNFATPARSGAVSNKDSFGMRDQKCIFVKIFGIYKEAKVHAFCDGPSRIRILLIH